MFFQVTLYFIFPTLLSKSTRRSKKMWALSPHSPPLNWIWLKTIKGLYVCLWMMKGCNKIFDSPRYSSSPYFHVSITMPRACLDIICYCSLLLNVQICYEVFHQSALNWKQYEGNICLLYVFKFYSEQAQLRLCKLRQGTVNFTPLRWIEPAYYEFEKQKRTD